MNVMNRQVFTQEAIAAIERECLQFGPLEVSREQAEREYRRHTLSAASLTDDLGNKPRYRAAEVLLALGY